MYNLFMSSFFYVKNEKWWEFLWAMTQKEIKARYKKAVLGFLWMILNPLLQMLAIGFIFQFFVPIDVDNYFLFLFSGLLLWNFFSCSVSKNTSMIVNERFLIKKAKFPREVIIISVVLADLFHILIFTPIFLLVVFLYGNLNFYWFLLIPCLFLLLTLLTIGFSLAFSALDVKFRDVNFAVSAIMPIWLYATPIMYNLSLLPSKIANFFYLNPMTSIVEIFRFLVLGIPVYSWKLALVSLTVSTLVVFVLGIFIFKKEEPLFDDWL